MSRAVRVILAIICALALCVRVESDANDVAFYLPLAEWSGSNMGIWQIVQPVATTNEVENPSFENNVTDGWTLTNGARAQTTDQSLWGSYSLEHTADAALVSTMTSSAISLADGASITASTWAYRGTTTPLGNISIRDTTTPDTRATTALTADVSGEWERLIATWTNTTGGAVNVVIWLRNTTADGASIIYWDGVQAEPHDYATTYCDGDQDGCEWAGTAHNSTSDRSALSRAGGRVREFTDFNFNIGSMISTGAAPVNVNVDEYAILPGGQAQSYKIRPRVFTLTGVFRSTSLEQLHADRQGLYDLLKPDAVPETASGPQPVILRYSGADVEKEIFAHYESGLEAQIRAEIDCWERVGIRFIADDPFFYAVGENSEPLDTNDTATTRYVAGRLKSTGQWDDLGLTSNPTGGGPLRAVLFASDGSVYVGGTFTGMDGVVGRDYIARYIPSTDTWETVGAGSAINSDVYAIAEAPNGDIYIGGDFTNVADANGDYVAFYDVSAGAWSSVSGGGTAWVLALAFGPDGTLYIGGNFVNWNGIAAADRFVTWDGAAYAAIAGTTLAPGAVNAITVRDGDGQVFAGGSFANAGGDADADNIAQHDGSDWSALASTPLNDLVWTLDFDTDGTLYIGGMFTNAGGDTGGDFVCMWNGTSFLPLGTGLDNDCRTLVARNGSVYAGGDFTTAGNIAIADRVARWNGSTWTHVDINLPGTPLVYALDLGREDPIVSSNIDFYVTFWDTGTAFFSGGITVTNDATEPSFPILTIERAGGTSAILTMIRNETSGKTLWFDYSLLDGEKLTIDLRSTQKTIMSSFSGNRPDAALANSDMGTFSLLSGDNQITCFVDVSGAPTITAFVLWQDTFWGQD
jgi:hypothetical protein